MNKAVIYINGTMNETVDNMVVRVIERYCEKHGYEIAALLGESSQSGMSMHYLAMRMKHMNLKWRLLTFVQNVRECLKT